MITKRIIPCLDVKDGRVVKGVNFLGLADVSSPVKLAKFYSDSGADELVFYDITTSSEGRYETCHGFDTLWLSVPPVYRLGICPVPCPPRTRGLP